MNNNDADETDEARLREQLAELRSQHRSLDLELASLEAMMPPDQFSLVRLKKQKLFLKDQIARLEDKLFPDIIA